MNELLPIKVNDDQKQTVSARALHSFLGMTERFSKWFEKQIEYGFSEKVDYTSVKTFTVVNNGAKRELDDYDVNVDMAKEISMLAKNERGKQARQYFIQLEKDWNSPEKTMARALLMADKQIKKLVVINDQQARQIKEQEPKVLFAKSVEASKTSVLIGELAKIIKQNGIDIGRDRLFEWMRANGYLEKRGENRNLPTQRSMEMGLFEIKKSTIDNPDGSIRTTRTTKVTGKGQIYFVNIFLANNRKEGAAI